MTGWLRYLGLGTYAGLVAEIISLKVIPLDFTTITALLAPIALVVTADLYKHRNDGN